MADYPDDKAYEPKAEDLDLEPSAENLVDDLLMEMHVSKRSETLIIK